MINSDLSHVETLVEFNESIREQQEEAHGKDYCAIHDAIKKYMKECKSYMELGTHQGGTASTAMLCNPEFIQLVDIDFSRYNKFLAPIARKYCKENDIKLSIKQADSTGLGSTAWVDMLVIDSYHHPQHMIKELNMHAGHVSKYIIAHDTSVLHGNPNDSLYRVLKNFASDGKWEIIEHNTNNVGYTVLKKQ